ncbi:unnamed protein product [Somion occarium]|uniref:DH domain-containing protein n=1 Tax=Somion occarium TaxID=3059160 RepID=A0ABP1CIH3_9APHY
MNAGDFAPPGSKPFPSPVRDDRLPPIPSDHETAMNSPPPPQIVHDQDTFASQQTVRGVPPPINTSGGLSPNDYGLSVPPITPISPVGAVSSGMPPSPSAEGKPKKTNPLTDLVETEKVYVDLLTGIIRKVAAAWSRSNLPPPELDTMFRSVEGVYRANRSLLAKLKEIGTSPSSPKALGDLLMRWIDDLETPYTTYAANYCAGFDVWGPVQSNPRLRTTLAIFSSSNPPPLPPSSPPHPAEPPLWTLDDLFILPKDRLKYYKKLYSRLLKSTQPGRSDHRLLTGALDKLDGLLSTVDQRSNLKIGDNFGAPPPTLAPTTEDEVVIDMRSRNSNGLPPKNFMVGPPSNRDSDSTGAGSVSSRGRMSQETAPTSEDRGSTATLGMPITDLERRLSTERTLDIFTMKPKQVRLQISPPTLHYTRELRISADVVLNLIPRSTGIEVIQERGHIFILTDLLLICERMTKEEMSRYGPDGPDMWLLYPPLAGKHLRVAPVEGSATALNVTILRKETLTVSTGSPQTRDRLVYEFRECIDAGATLLPPSKNAQPPPPVPPLPGTNNLPRSPSAPLERNLMYPPNEFPPSARSSGSLSPPSRALSPGSLADGRVMSPPMGPGILDGMARMGLAPDPRMNPQPGQTYPPPRSSSAAPGGPGPSFAPGQVMPGSGFGPGQVMQPPSFGPGQTMPPFQGGPGQIVPPPRGASTVYRGPGGPPPPAMGLPDRPGPQGMQYNGPPVSNARFSGGSGYPPSRPPSDGSYGSSLRKSPSSRSLASQYEQMPPNGMPPPMPAYPDGLPPPRPGFLPRNDSSGSLSSLQAPQPRPLLPSAQLSLRSVSTAVSFVEPSPPNSPVEESPQYNGPVTSTVSAQMKCKVFLKQHHAAWKSLGSAKLKLYRESPTNIKQLVVEADNSKKTVMISTIVLPDGVERVGRTGVAVELSDKGLRTGIVYMLQLRNEQAAQGLFDSLLAGSDRSEAAGRA